METFVWVCDFALPEFCFSWGLFLVLLGSIEFEDADLSTLPQPVSTPDTEKKDFANQDKNKKEGGGGGGAGDVSQNI